MDHFFCGLPDASLEYLTSCKKPDDRTYFWEQCKTETRSLDVEELGIEWFFKRTMNCDENCPLVAAIFFLISKKGIEETFSFLFIIWRLCRFWGIHRPISIFEKYTPLTHCCAAPFGTGRVDVVITKIFALLPTPQYDSFIINKRK